MAGLFDFYDDPQQAARLAFGAGLLSAGGPQTRPVSVGQALAGGLLASQQAGTEAAFNQRRNALTDIQLQHAQRQAEEFARMQQQRTMIEEAQRAATLNPAGAAMLATGNRGPTVAAGAQMEANPNAGGFNPSMFVKNIQSNPGIDPLTALKYREAFTPAPMKLGKGDTLYDPQANKAIFTAPDKEDIPGAVREYQFAVTQGFPGTFQEWTMQNNRAKAPSTQVMVNTGQKGLDNELKLRGDFRQEPIYKAHQEVQSAYQQIKAGIKLASPAGDLAAATKIMKILDPGSVVRESELAMAMQASGLMDRLTNYANMVVTGQKLTPKQRQDFNALADALMSESVKTYNAKRGEYAGFARDYQLNEGRTVGSPAAAPVVDYGQMSDEQLRKAAGL